MKKYCIFATIFLLYSLSSCKDNLLILPEIDCSVELSINMYPDSSFFSDIRSMQYDNGRVYALDVQRRDIAVLDENFKNIKLIGSPGRGPSELNEPYNFYVDSGIIYISDVGIGIKSYKDSYLANYLLPIGMPTDKRFFIFNNKFYYPFVTDTTSIALFTKQTDKLVEFESNYAGSIFNFDHPTQNLIRNSRFLLHDKKYCYAVSDNLPIIEKYDLHSMKLIETYDYSNIDFIDKNINKSKDKTPNSFFGLVKDAYISDGLLFILCHTRQGDDYRVNSILNFTLNTKIEPENIYILPGKYYSSFCISPSHIISFNNEENSIEKIALTK